jgi:alginate O-acetyltransferase complex protein AlgI
MLFVSHSFLELFLPAAIVAFYAFHAIRPRFGLFVVLLASLIFCSANGVWQAGLLVCSVLFNFGVGASLAALPDRRILPRKCVLIGGIAVDLALLGYFKYAGFIVANLNSALGFALDNPHATLPIGISFYTFTQIAYLADVYAGRGPARQSLSNYALFVTYFPHVVAGPIIHWREMMPQFEELGKRTSKLLSSPELREVICRGVTLFGIGLAKKVFIADQLAPFVEKGYASASSIGFADAWLLSLSYTFQLYYDFSGYSDMAIGMSLIFGIKLPFNFNSPYRALSIQDFWHRWHMTLSRWFRDYVYIPLGGNRAGLVVTLRNLFVTFLLGGLWHGAGWTFVVWGALHGVAYSIHRLWQETSLRLPTVLAVCVTFLFVNTAWVVFRAPNLAAAIDVLSAMVSPVRTAQILPREAWALVALAALPIWTAPASQHLALETRIGINPLTASLVGACVLLAIVAQNSSAPSPFLYFNF